MLIHNKDDIKFVTEFPCFLGHPVYELSYNFNTVLYQFLEVLTSDKTFMGRDQELK